MKNYNKGSIKLVRTDDASASFCIYTASGKLAYESLELAYHSNFHMHILSEELILAGDYFMRDEEIHKALKVYGDEVEFETGVASVYCGANTFWPRKSCRKIVASSDKNLGLPMPGYKFIEEFIYEYNLGKNKISNVLLERNEGVCKCDSFEQISNCCYSFGEDCIKPNPNNDFYGLMTKINEDNTINIQIVKEIFLREDILKLFEKMVVRGCLKTERDYKIAKETLQEMTGINYEEERL